MTSTTQRAPRREPQRIGGSLLLVLICLAAWTLFTAFTAREPLKMMLEWELLAVFVRHETHGWYRTVITMVGLDVMTGVLIVTGAGWLALLASRKASSFKAHAQMWLLAIVAMRIGAYLLGASMSRAIGIDIAVPLDGALQAAIAAALGIPYFRWSRRVQRTFVNP